MSGSATAFAKDAPGVSSAESVREGEFIHVYEGTLESEESVRFLTLAPDIDDEAAAEAFTRTAGKWVQPNTHPNIVSVYERDDEPRPWIAVADLTGQSLDAVQPSLSPAETKTVISDVGEALRNAVLYNTYHLDLRPDHIWVVPDEEGVTGLVDEWGLERAVRVAVGEPDVTPFTAPEVVEELNAGDERTDVYGLGALAYFALTGQPPITAGTDLASAITAGDITPPTEVYESLSPAVNDIVMQALATDPANRPDSAYSFKHAFAQAFTPSGQPGDGDGAAATAGAATGATASDGEEADDQAETDDESVVSRRAALGMLGVGVVGVGGGWMAAQMGSNNDDESAAATVPTDTATETPLGTRTRTPTETETPEETETSDDISASPEFRLNDQLPQEFDNYGATRERNTNAVGNYVWNFDGNSSILTDYAWGESDHSGTLCGWFYFPQEYSGSSDRVDLLSAHDGGRDGDYEFEQLSLSTNVGESGVGLYKSKKGGPKKFVAGDYPISEWFHLAGVIDKEANQIRAYINGNEVDSKTDFTITMEQEGAFGIGAKAKHRFDEYAFTLYFNGKVDDVRMYDEVLSEDEISILASNG